MFQRSIISPPVAWKESSFLFLMTSSSTIQSFKLCCFDPDPKPYFPFSPTFRAYNLITLNFLILRLDVQGYIGDLFFSIV